MFKLVRELTILGYYAILLLLAFPFLLMIVAFGFAWELLNARQA